MIARTVRLNKITIAVTPGESRVKKRTEVDFATILKTSSASVKMTSDSKIFAYVPRLDSETTEHSRISI